MPIRHIHMELRLYAKYFGPVQRRSTRQQQLTAVGCFHPRTGPKRGHRGNYSFFNLGTRCEWVVNANPWPLYSREIDPFLFHRRLGGPRVGSVVSPNCSTHLCQDVCNMPLKSITAYWYQSSSAYQQARSSHFITSRTHKVYMQQHGVQKLQYMSVSNTKTQNSMTQSIITVAHVLTFRNHASSLQDRRFATLQRTLFIYLINKYISLSDICLTVHHSYK